MKVLIPAKSNSIRIYNKNFRDFYNNESLVELLIKKLLKIFNSSDIYLSCDEDKKDLTDKYNINLAKRRMEHVLNMLDPQLRDTKHNSNNLEYFVAGESDDMAQYGGDGRTSNPRERAVCVIISSAGAPKEFVQISSAVSVKQDAHITITKGNHQTLEQRIKSIVAYLRNVSESQGTSVWKNKEGNFNSSRLVSDSVAGVVLGTAGGLITSNVIKKNQVKGGFEDISCTIGGQVVAGWKDEFRVGIH